MKTFHIAHTTTPGDGLTKARPLDGRAFDAAIARIKADLATSPKTPTRLLIGPGEYLTRAVAPFANWDIELDPKATLKLMDVHTQGFRHPTNYVIATAPYGSTEGPAWLENFSLTGGTLDCNWPAQSGRTHPGEKFGGVWSVSARTTIRNVRVINFGSNGLTVPGAAQWEYAEVFPIVGETYADESTRIRIENCTVELQHRYQGGYATAINVITTQDRPVKEFNGSFRDLGDRFKWDVPRKSLAALVLKNRCVGIYGNAFGCGWAERVLFQENIAERCKTGSNIDTGRNRSIEFYRNQFLACHQGLQIGQPWAGEFAEFKIRQNLFHLTGPWVNEDLQPPRTEYSHGIRLDTFPSKFEIEDNTFLAWPAWDAKDGLYGIGFCNGAKEDGKLTGNRFVGVDSPIVRGVPFHLEQNRKLET